MNTIENKLAKLGLRLEAPKQPVANYISCKQTGNLLFVSGRVSDLRGEVGIEINEADAKKAAHDTVLLLLAIIKETISDLDRVKEIIKLQGFIRSASSFTNQPAVLDGASELLIKLFGKNGRHARTATGVNQLPFGAAVQLDMILELK